MFNFEYFFPGRRRRRFFFNFSIYTQSVQDIDDIIILLKRKKIQKQHTHNKTCGVCSHAALER